MKHNISRKIFGWLAAASALVMMPACADDTFKDYNNADNSDEIKVTLTLAPEAISSNTRAVDYTGKKISDGSKADMLIYSVFLASDDADGNDIENDEILEIETRNDFENIELGYCQSAVKVNRFPYALNLTLKKRTDGKNYRIAFWAQSSKSDAYNTKDLRKVEVIYSELQESIPNNDNPSGATTEKSTSTPCNDERRDAFCRSVTILGNSSSVSQNVYLYRPLAQINVGTSGYDFEIINRERAKNEQYLYSKIRVNRVARYLNVVKDKTYTTTTGSNPYTTDDREKTQESFAVVDYGYAPIPAYENYYDENRTQCDMPPYPTYTKWDWEYTKGDNDNSSFVLERDGYKIGDYDGNDNGNELDYHNIYDKEEFLYVHNDGFMSGDNKKGTTKGMKPNEYEYGPYANYNNYIDYESETFKYLAMCYVLTSSTKDDPVILYDVKCYLAKDESGKDEIEVFSIDNVPAQRNWRTNIIGNLLSVEKKFSVKLDTDFAGEWSGWVNDKDWEWSGPLANGVYYDAEADEIQISSKEGLLWFQMMVNGKLLIRDTSDKVKNEMTEEYPYYNEAGKTLRLKDIHIDPGKLSDEQLKRIVKATHLEENKLEGTTTKLSNITNIGSKNDIPWPKFYNFNFYKSTVKLMADIDLEGEEWIPIGYDIAIHDNTISDDNNKINYKDVKRQHGKRRFFCGTFDGNGHTIYNLKNRRFGAQVHDEAVQSFNGKRSFYDNVQWMPAGFFGLIGAGSVIKNLHFVNIDLFGYHTAGAVAGMAFSYGEEYTSPEITIENCSVDGGSIILSPMYRGDTSKEGTGINSSRTFARGIYAGGIIGHMVAPEGSKIAKCTVRNATIQAYRRIGGILGSISNSEQDAWKDDNYNIDIKDNSVINTTIIANKFQPYDRMFCDWANETWKNGFGWVVNQQALGGYFVGGITSEGAGGNESLINSNNNASNVIFTELATGVGSNSDSRNSEIGNIPLSMMPILSSWFTDNIQLTGNYSGKAAAKTRTKIKSYQPWLVSNGGYDSYEMTVPMDLPNDLSINYLSSAPNVGMYVESVTLNGSDNPKLGLRSVISAEDVENTGACVMYITARDRTQFSTYISDNSSDFPNNISYSKPTEINNLVLRGEPYAFTGILIAPNENMSEVKLNNVAIYDVYQTIALDNGSLNNGQWPNNIENSHVALSVKDSNLRGYTVPGKGWKSVIFEKTTFGAGGYYKDIIEKNGASESDRYTYKVEATTTFDNCYFKAPYIIDLTNLKNEENGNITNTVTFKGKCQATGLTTKNIELYTGNNNEGSANSETSLQIPDNAKKIIIDTDIQGNPTVKFLDSGGNEIK